MAGDWAVLHAEASLSSIHHRILESRNRSTSAVTQEQAENMMHKGYTMVEGSLEVKLPTIWTDEKQSRAEAERRGRLEERRSEEKE